MVNMFKFFISVILVFLSCPSNSSDKNCSNSAKVLLQDILDEQFKRENAPMIESWEQHGDRILSLLEESKDLEKSLDGLKSGNEIPTPWKLFLNKKFVPYLIAKSRKRLDLKSELLAMYFSHCFCLNTVLKVLEAQDISDELAADVIVVIRNGLLAHDAIRAGAAIESLKHTSVGKTVATDLAQDFMGLLEGEHSLEQTQRILLSGLDSSNPSVINFLEEFLFGFKEIFPVKRDGKPTYFAEEIRAITETYSSLIHLQKQGPAKSLGEAAEIWLGQSGVATKFKAEFLLRARNRQVGRYVRQIPEAEWPLLWEQIKSKFSVRNFNF